ncbi:MAG TPA: methyltransferase domain-containing protein [Polyangiaceae bacterium]
MSIESNHPPRFTRSTLASNAPVAHEDYVHGYSNREAVRLHDQATTLAALLHDDSYFPPGSRVLEAGCGVGAQTVTLATQNPLVSFVSVDRSLESIEQARSRCANAGVSNVEFIHGDLMSMRFDGAWFDHVFLCFVLEHVTAPEAMLNHLIESLRPGGTVTAIEGDHGSTFFHPDSKAAQHLVDSLIELQKRAGGDACIGRRLYPLFEGVGLGQVKVSPRFVYADRSRPSLHEGFTLNTFTAMIEGIHDAVLASGLADEDRFRRGILELRRCAESDGVFCYTFFKAIGQKLP